MEPPDASAPRVLHVLIVEDSEDDAGLLRRELSRLALPVEARRVETEEAMAAALAEREWDLVLSDYNLPAFDGLRALRMLQSSGHDVPFILVSGHIGEEAAADVMRAGAHDFLSKSNLSRLPPAVARELGEAEGRRAGRRAQESLRFLGTLSAALAETLDVEATLTRVAHLVVPTVADLCVVDKIADDRGSPRSAWAHVDEAKEPLLRRLEEVGLDLDSSQPAAIALRTGNPVLIPDFDAATLAAHTRSAAHADLLRDLGARQGLAVPLTARGHSLGAITFVRGAIRPAFDGADVDLAVETARRAAIALDNAVLFGQAQEAIHARDEFLSIASHELKTPLTTLLLQLDWLRLQVAREGDESHPRLVRHCETTERQLTRLSRLVNELLDVSRVSGGVFELNREEMDLSAFVGDIIARERGVMEAAGCTPKLDAPPMLLGAWDRTRLDQVITNLLTNACKYGAGTPVEVRIEGDEATVRISVADHGIGIAPADHQRIFERFERAVSHRNYGGLGLGLWIAHRIARAHGGGISVESELDHGARFIVELTRRETAQPHAAHGGQPAA